MKERARSSHHRGNLPPPFHQVEPQLQPCHPRHSGMLTSTDCCTSWCCYKASSQTCSRHSAGRSTSLCHVGHQVLEAGHINYIDLPSVADSKTTCSERYRKMLISQKNTSNGESTVSRIFRNPYSTCIPGNFNWGCVNTHLLNIKITGKCMFIRGMR